MSLNKFCEIKQASGGAQMGVNLDNVLTIERMPILGEPPTTYIIKFHLVDGSIIMAEWDEKLLDRISGYGKEYGPRA